MIRSIVAGVCFIAGASCLWWVTRTSYSYPWRILILFAAGMVLGLTAGVLFGRVIRDRFVKRSRGIPLFIALALLNLSVFTFLGKPLPVEYEDITILLAGILLPILGVALIALNAYLLGFLLVPGKKGPSRTRGLRWVVPLYASLLTGIVLGLNTGIWQRGVVPLEPIRSTASDEPEMTWREALETTRDSFPPSITTKELDDGSILIETDWTEEPDYSTVRRVIDATGTVVMVDDTKIECLGYAMLPPPEELDMKILRADDEDAFHEYAQELISHATFWTIDGQPAEPRDLSDYVICPWLPGLSSPWNQLCIFIFSAPEEAPVPVDGISLVRLPWAARDTWAAYLTGEGVSYGIASLGMPIPGGAEFRFQVFLGNRNEYTMPAVEGSSLTLETNRVLLARLYPWRYEKVTTAGSWGRLAITPPQPDSGAADPTSAGATVVLWCSLMDMAPAVRVEAVLASGERRKGDLNCQEPFVVTRFDVALHEIESLRVLEAPGAVEIRYPIPRLQGLPPENENLTNRLDMWYASVDLRHWHDESTVGSFLGDALGDRYRPETFSSYVYAPREPHRNVTVRDILNYYFPGRWWVRDGIVYTSCDRFGPVAWKVREALREVSGKGIRSRMRE